MRRIAIIGDVHGHEARLARVLHLLRRLGPDLVLVCGDVGLDPPFDEPARSHLRNRHDRSVHEVLLRIRGALDVPVVFVPGDHDLRDPSPEWGCVNCDGRTVSRVGLSITGLGGAGPEPAGLPYEWTEGQADASLRRAFSGWRGRADILLCHVPPAGSDLERTWSGARSGSLAVASWLERRRPALFVCGHIHEAWGVEAVHATPCLNAGSLGDPFGQALVWTVDWGLQGPRRIVAHLQQAGNPPISRAFFV